MSRRSEISLSDDVWASLLAESERTGESVSGVIERAVSSELGLVHHSIFQVSTSAALVNGVFEGVTTVRDLKFHGDFGLGTFDGLDGELIMIDGACYQATADGVVREADDEWATPFALVTRFVADEVYSLTEIGSFEALRAAVDDLKPSENVFVGLRVEGTFGRLALRTACKADPGEGLVAATSHQSEFAAENIKGSLVGFRSPPYSKAISVPGYHLHFIDEDRSFGGHVLEFEAAGLEASLHLETDVHVAIPETRAFLEADLRADPSADLDIAETEHRT